MSPLYFCSLERRDFGDVLSAEGLSRLVLRSASTLEGVLKQRARAESLLAVWWQAPQDSGQLPDLLICSDGTEEDWVAWITTYAARIRPYSAYTRLISYTGIERVVRAWRTPVLDRLTWPVAGLVLGEVLAASGLPDKRLEKVSAAACASTLSFAMFRAAAVYSNFQQWSQLTSTWESVRQITRQRARAVDGSSVARVCATVLDAAGLGDQGALTKQSDREVRIACNELLASPEHVPSNLTKFSDFATIERRMHGSREDSVVAFDNFVRVLSATSANDFELTAFMLGYLASRIAPGTMRHSSVLAPIGHRYPTALLWYGFCAGLGGAEGGSVYSPNSRRTSVDLPVSARRIVRDLLRPSPVVGPPECDISSLELIALSRTGGDPLEAIITTTQGTATVELTPAVWTTVNALSKETPVEGQVRTLRDKVMLATIGECIERLRGAYSELTRTEHPDDEGGQRSMFPTRRRKR